MAFNWQELKSKTSPYLAKVTPLIDKAQELGEQALDFTGKQLQNTPIIIKSEAELTELKKEKRLIVIAIEDGTPASQEVLLRSAVWSTIAWTEVASLRLLSISQSPELARSQDFSGPVSMKVYWNGELKHAFSDLESIKKWWNDRNYDGAEKSDTPPTHPLTPTEAIKTPEVPADPLL